MTDSPARVGKIYRVTKPLVAWRFDGSNWRQEVWTGVDFPRVFYIQVRLPGERIVPVPDGTFPRPPRRSGDPNPNASPCWSRLALDPSGGRGIMPAMGDETASAWTEEALEATVDRLVTRLRRRDPLAERVVLSRPTLIGHAAMGAARALARRGLGGRRPARAPHTVGGSNA